MSKRSPRYPRHNLTKSIDLIKKLFDGAHQSKVDVDTAARIIGYSNSTSGAAASALGALRQFGLVDGLRGDIGVSDLAMKILQPLDSAEKNLALYEAASKPEIFSRILSQFNGNLPASDEPIKAFLIRNEGFSVSGASELLEALRDTFQGLPKMPTESSNDDSAENLAPVDHSVDVAPLSLQIIPPASSTPLATDEANSQLIVLPLGSSCKAELRFIGELTPSAYARLIRHLELMKDMLSEDSA